MHKKFEILDEQVVFQQAIFTVRAARLKHECYDGSMSSELIRLNLDRGDSIAALVHDVARDLLVFTEQFRYPTISAGPGWLLELPAGSIDAEETPKETLARELLEETGLAVSSEQLIGTFFLTPGGSSERVLLYYVTVNIDSKIADGGGASDEGEDIKVVTLSVADAMASLKENRIHDAKTIIGLQWLALQNAESA